MHPSLVLPWCESLEAREWLPERVETVEGDASMIRGFEERLDGLVLSTPLKNIGQNGNLPQIGMEIENIWNHHVVEIQLVPREPITFIFRGYNGYNPYFVA